MSTLFMFINIYQALKNNGTSQNLLRQKSEMNAVANGFDVINRRVNQKSPCIQIIHMIQYRMNKCRRAEGQY